jgi:ketosteroid isomerase-like protein
MARVGAAAVDDVFATTTRNACAELGRLLRQNLETVFAGVHTLFEISRLRRAANAHAFAELEALFAFAVATTLIVVGIESVHTMSALLAVFDVAPSNGRCDRNSQ